jgi:hypothetical protein
MNANAQALGRSTQRKSVVDLGSPDVIETESLDFCEWQISRRRRKRMRWKARTAGKKLVHEALQVVVVSIRKQPATLK